MKSLFIVLSILFSTPVYAGAANCSGTTQITASGLDYYASTSDCIISVEKTVSEDTFIHLPANAQAGDEFTIQDNTSYSLDTCDSYYDEESMQTIYYCWPYGFSIQSMDAGNGVLVDGGDLLSDAGYYLVGSPHRDRIKLTFDGSNWQAEYSTF